MTRTKAVPQVSHPPIKHVVGIGGVLAPAPVSPAPDAAPESLPCIYGSAGALGPADRRSGWLHVLGFMRRVALSVLSPGSWHRGGQNGGPVTGRQTREPQESALNMVERQCGSQMSEQTHTQRAELNRGFL